MNMHPVYRARRLRALAFAANIIGYIALAVLMMADLLWVKIAMELVSVFAFVVAIVAGAMLRRMERRLP